MRRDVVKVTQTPGQTRITIPKVIAEETGLDKALIVVVESMSDRSVKIWEWFHAKEKEGGV